MPAQRAEPIWTSIAGEVAFAAPGDTSTTRHLVQVCGLNRCFWPAAAALASNVLGGYPKNSDNYPNTSGVFNTLKYKIRAQGDSEALCK
jgi:hypothetical protein